MTIRLHDTLRRAVVPLQEKAGEVRLYACGITPYDAPHVGHLRSAVFFDAFVRYLRGTGRKVRFVRNITDVDDKIIVRARAEGTTPEELAARNIALYESALRAAGCLPPDAAPRVTEKIPEIRDFIARLVERGLAYAAQGSVYFRVRAFAEYGALSGRNLEALIEAGERGEGEAPGKEDPLDFALWKAAKEGEPSWESPWGAGRPGWHIECSAMSRAELGDEFEIHGGGLDLAFPHHENEIAQSRGAGFAFAQIWMHHGLVVPEGGDEKMSKSLGNVVSAAEVVGRLGPARTRLLLLLPHYRSPLTYGEKALGETGRAAERLDSLLRRAALAAGGRGTPPPEFLEALADDFHTPRAFALLFDKVAEGNRLLDGRKKPRALEIASSVRAGLDLLGIGDLARDLPLAPEEEALVRERDAARRARDFARADEIRAELTRRGIEIEDALGGARARKRGV